ncbi:thermonuclease family protein [bacterium]|nr:thermonuclease family protein [bacterium]
MMQRRARGSRKRRKVALIRLTLAVLFTAVGIAGYFTLRPAGQAGRQKVTLIKVSDGDTIRVRDGRGNNIKVRLVGIDTQELGTAASFRSALFAAEMLEGAREIHLEPEPSKPVDKYGRTLGWVWVVTPDGNEVLLQEELLRAGLAELYRDAKGSKHYSRLERVR